MVDNVIECQLDSNSAFLDEDQTLVAAARHDPEAAGKLFDKYYREIFGYIYHCTLDTHTTEDLTSNVFLSTLQHLGRYKLRQIPFRAWIFRVATNEIRMHWRRKKRFKIASLLSDEDKHSTEQSAIDNMTSAEEFRLLHKALLELTLNIRFIIL